MRVFSYFIPTLRLPFNHETLLGYGLALILQAVPLFALMLCGTTIISYLVGSAWAFIMFVDDITMEMSKLNPIKPSKTADHEKSNVAKTQRQQEMKTILFSVIQLCSDVKQLSQLKWLQSSDILKHDTCVYLIRFVADFNACYEFLIFTFILWALLSISSSLLMMNAIMRTIVKC